jgi:2-polyprenyl-6-methoxyphenol hydroxylase-like FAD-dependent oxidoreductase
MKVIVVGAGPAGAATALLLARCGIDVTLLERESDSARVFRGEGLMPSGIDALLQMGFGRQLAVLPSRRLESWDIYLDGRETIVLPEPVEELGERAVRVVSQPALLDLLVQEAGKHSSFTFEPGVRVRDLVRAEGRVAGVEVETAGGLRELRADLVIGCDGRGSVVRSRAGLQLDLLPEHYDVLWFKIPAPDRLRDGCRFLIMVAAGADPAACYTSWDGRLQYGLMLPKGGFQRLRDADWLAHAKLAAPPWLAGHLERKRGEVEGPVHLNVIVGRCRQWVAPGALLIGDAAHPMSPVRAQGINLALRDAIVAANHLVPALRSQAPPDALDAAAHAVQAEREPEIVRAQALQLREARGQADVRNATWRYRFAKYVARMVGRRRWVQRLWLYKQRDLRFGSVLVELRV